MKAFDLHRMALDKVPMDFLGKLRYAASTPLYWFSVLKITGRRGVRQMSLLKS